MASPDETPVPGDDLFSREELLSGRLHRDRRSAKLLKAIEGRVTYMLAEARWAISTYLLGHQAEFNRNFDADYFESFKLSLQPSRKLTAPDLERFAPQWEVLVPAQPAARAALLHLLAQRYSFYKESSEQIQAALRAGDQDVQEAYRQAYGRPIDSVFSQEPVEVAAPALSAEEQALRDAKESLEWLHLPGGAVLFTVDEPADSLYIVISGRLRVVAARTGSSGRQTDEGEAVADVGQGELIGETEVLTGERRSTTVYALRDSELVKLPREALIRLAQHYPQAVMHLNRVMANRLRSHLAGTQRPVKTLITVAVVPAGPNLPLTGLTRQLVAALSDIGPSLHLDSALVTRELGADLAQIPQGHPDEGRLLAWLGEQEVSYRYIVYEADASPSHWSSRCLRQADRILIVAASGSNPAPSEIELQLAQLATRPHTELVLLHPATASRPSGTRRWLSPRQVKAYHHVRLGNADDLGRLVRRLTGRAIGVVMSGGGARGYAHLGVIRALEEAQIPVDYIGGTSMGALTAGFYAVGYRYRDLPEMLAAFGSRRKLLDLTLPLTSLFATRKVTRLLQSVLRDVDIEDLWQPYFCVSSNLTRSEPVVHQEGPLWMAVRASLAIPTVFAPVLRGSDLLVDGGIMNNFPLDVMRDMCEGGTVLGVNVSPPQDKVENYQFGSILSGWKVLQGKLHLATEPVRAPSLFSTLMRTMEINGTYKIRSNSFQNLADVLIQPPLAHIGILDFSSHGEIIDVGYRTAQEEIARWKASKSSEAVPRTEYDAEGAHHAQ
jgi:NTE family protein/lysophospholipid hydrolase